MIARKETLEKVKTLKKESYKKLKEVKEKGVEQIQEHPIKAIAICFAVGAVIGATVTAILKRQ